MLAAFGVSAGVHAALLTVCVAMAAMSAGAEKTPREPVRPQVPQMPMTAAVEVDLVRSSPLGQVRRGEPLGRQDSEGGAADVQNVPDGQGTPAPEPAETSSAASVDEDRTPRPAPAVRRPRRQKRTSRPVAVPQKILPTAPAETASPEIGASDEPEPPEAPEADDLPRGEAVSDGLAASGSSDGDGDRPSESGASSSEGALSASGMGQTGLPEGVASGRGSPAGIPGGAGANDVDEASRALSMIAARLSAAASGACYPRQARRRGIEGVAEIRFCIGEDGRAGGVELVRTSGSPLLDGAAACVVESASPFGPLARKQCVSVPVRFRLRR